MAGWSCCFSSSHTVGRTHGWHWAVHEGVDLDLFPALESQSLLLEMTLEPSNSTVLILHPRFSIQSSNNIIMPPPAYADEEYSEVQHWILSAM